jgi:abequosyltransferase
MIEISFCIPTLNRASVLQASLSSITSQADERIEIIIVDGGSTDDTIAVIETFKASFPQICVYRTESRNGVDRDILQSVAMARGRFCWLFSDDDLLAPGALERVLRLIEDIPAISGASLNYAAYDATMSYSIATVPAIGRNALRGDHLFCDRKECFSLLGVHLGFISCQVVRRSLWEEVARSNDVTSHCNAWIIVHMIGKMLERNPYWFYVHDVCVSYRSGNDSFLSRVGCYKRQQIAHIAYADTIGSLFPPDSKTYRDVFNIMVNDRMPRILAVLKSKGIAISLQSDLFRLYLRQYWSYPLFWIKVLPIFFVPNAALRLTEKIYRWLRKRKRAVQPRTTVENFELPSE